MTALFQQLLDWVSLHPLWAGGVIFFVAMSESLAIVGIVVPGVVIMFGIGALIATGAISFWSAFSWAVAGAIIGDGLSFWLGRKLQHRTSEIWPFNRHPETLEHGIEFFRRYGGKSVAIGRFFGPVRAVIPLVAGMLGMSVPRYLAANILSAFAWAPAYLLPGIAFGASLELASQVAIRLVILVLLLALLIWLTIRLTRLLFKLLQPHATSWLQTILRWTRPHPILSDITEALADPNHPEAKGLAILATLLILAVGIFALTLNAVLGGPTLHGIDPMILNTLQSLRTPWADHLMVFGSRLTDGVVASALILGVLLFLAWQRHWRSMVYWLAAVGFALFASVLLKYALQIPRPPLNIEGLGPYAFPSSHTLRAVVLFGFLSVMIARGVRSHWRWLAYTFAGLLILWVSIARLYLGAHWFSDILGSLTLGLVWVTLLGIAYHRHTVAESHWLGLSLLSLMLLVTTHGALTLQRHHSDLERYAPHRLVTEMDYDLWWNQGWAKLPLARQDLLNQNDHPFTIQYAGHLEPLYQHLVKRDWERAQRLSPDNVLKLLSTELPLAQLPIPPQVHDGQHDTLTLTRKVDQQLLALRLWPSDITLTPGQTPLWIGTITRLEKKTLLNFFSFPKTQERFHAPFERLGSDFSGLTWKQPTKERDLALIGLSDHSH